MRMIRSHGRADLGVVGHDHESLAALAVEAAEEGQDIGRPRRVEVPGRLVTQHQRGPIDERPGDRNALLLAAGELGGSVPRAIGQADEIERRERLGPPLGAAVAGVFGGERDVLGGAERRDEVVRLEDEAELFGAGRVRAPSESFVMSRPPITRLGAGVPSRSGWWSRPRMCMRVLLPDPDGPMIATISPASIVTSTPRRACDARGLAEPIGLAQVAAFEQCHVRRSYSYRRAWTGSSRAAWTAGTIPATIPRTVAKTTAASAVPAVRVNRTVPESSPAWLPR